MKKYFRLILFTIICSLVMAFTYKVLSWKDTSGAYMSATQMLYETDKNLIDVVFMGSSHTYCAVNPNVMWEEKGISAFDLATSGQDLETTYYLLKELLRTQKPKVVMIDLYGLTFEKQEVIGNEYRNMLAIKPGINATKLVMERHDISEWETYLLRWPIIHTRYRELTKYDFVKNEYSVYGRGYIRNDYVESIDLSASSRVEEFCELDERSTDWMDRLMILSKEEDFELVFFIAPFVMNDYERRTMNSAINYLAERDVWCIDFNELTDEMGIDDKTDFCDFMHLNEYGASKMSAYITEEILSEYNLDNHKGDERFYLWEQNARHEREDY